MRLCALALSLLVVALAGCQHQQPNPDPAPTGGNAAVDAPTLPRCDTGCAADQECVLVQVECVRAPCPPVPQCRTKKQ